VNELQNLWLSSYRGYLQAASPLGELSPSDYTEAKEFADSLLKSLIDLNDALLCQKKENAA